MHHSCLFYSLSSFYFIYYLIFKASFDIRNKASSVGHAYAKSKYYNSAPRLHLHGISDHSQGKSISYLFICIQTSEIIYALTEKKKRVLIRDVRGVNARILLMLVTTHHAKHVLNYEYVASARNMHIFERVLT